MLNESHLYSFLDDKEGFAITFFEGQKLISDLVVMNQLKPQAMNFFRDSLLTIQPMIAFLKHGEGFGIYLDSEEPYLRLKVETNESGAVRTLLLPEDIDGQVEKMTGVCRVVKTFGRSAEPYTSIIQVNELNFKDVMNKVLKDSYQIDCKVFPSQISDQSILLMRLPNKNVDAQGVENRQTLSEYWLANKEKYDEIFTKALTDRNQIIKSFEDLGNTFLKDKEVQFKCPCSKEMMVSSIKRLSNNDLGHLFDEGKDTLETRCDYCKEAYQISKSDLI